MSEETPSFRLHEILEKAQPLPKEVISSLFALVDGLVKERDEWKRRAASHGCDGVNGDDDCG